MIKDYFKEKGLKLTKQREEIYNTIDKLEEAKLKDIIASCQNNMDNSTIYRIIELFLTKNIILKSLDDSGNVFYVINKEEHKHFIHCINCHEKIPIEICPIHDIENIGYKIISHQVILNGLCPKCQKK